MKMFQTLSSISVLALAGLASGATTSHYLRVNVPFSFIAAGQQFSAGEYNVSETDSGVLMLQGAGKAAAIITSPEALPKAGQPSSLRFTTHSSGRYLSSVEVEGEGTRAVPATALERKVSLSH